MALKLGELLVAYKVVTPEQVDQALQAQRMYGGKLGTNLIELKFISDDTLARFLSKQFQMPAAAALDFQKIPRDVLKLVPRDLASRHKLVPLRLEKKLIVAFSDPTELGVIDQIQFDTGKPVQAVIAPEIWIVAALERFYGVARELRFIPMKETAWSFGEEAVAVPGLTADISNPEFMIEGEPAEPIREVVPFKEFVKRVAGAATKEDVFSGLLDFLGAFFPRLAVYVYRKGSIVGWRVRGFALREGEFASVDLPLSEETILKGVMNTLTPFRGVLPRDTADQRAAVALGLSPDEVVNIFPVPFRKKGVAVVLALLDPAFLDKPHVAVQAAVQACEKAGLGLEALTLRRQILEIPPKP